MLGLTLFWANLQILMDRDPKLDHFTINTCEVVFQFPHVGFIMRVTYLLDGLFTEYITNLSFDDWSIVWHTIDYCSIFQMKKLVKGYLQEAIWFHNGYVPKVEEHMKVALVTGAYMMLATTSMVGMGDSLTTQTFDWVTNEPLIVRATSVIGRLMDDMAGHEVYIK